MQNIIKRPGSQSLPFAYGQARELVALCDGIRTSATFEHPFRRLDRELGGIPQLAQPKPTFFRSCIGVRAGYEAASLLLMGDARAALARARQEVERGPRMVPKAMVDGALAAVQAMRTEVEVRARRASEGHRDADTRFEALMVQGRAALRGLGDRASVRQLLYDLGARDGLRRQDGAAVRAILGDVFLGGSQEVRRAYTEVDGAADAILEDRLNDRDGLGYVATLLDRAGVPMRHGTFKQLPSDIRAMWLSDPSFDLSRLAMVQDSLHIPEFVHEIEAEVDVEMQEATSRAEAEFQRFERLARAMAGRPS